MKILFICISILALTTSWADDKITTNYELAAGTKVINLGLIKNSAENMQPLNYSLQFTRNKNSIKKVTVKYKLEYLKKKCTDYDVKQVMRPSFTQQVCTTVGDGSFQCEEKTYDQLFTAKIVCIEKGWVKEIANKEFTLSFNKAAALAPHITETFGVDIIQPKLQKAKVKISGTVIESPVRYTVKNRLFKDGLSFKVLH